MSKYTTEVRYICEVNSGFSTDDMSNYTPDEIIAAARAKIFNFSYPIYDTSHKTELETKILKHYYTREISAETVALWKLWLNERLNLIMPKYNKLYQMEAQTLNKLLYNIDVEKNSTREDDFTNHNTGTISDSENTESRDRYSDTPQGTISNVDNNTYLTDYRYMNGTRANTNTRNLTETNAGEQTYNEQETGYRGNRLYYEMLSDYNEKVLNIDNLIINELSDLFIYLW